MKRRQFAGDCEKFDSAIITPMLRVREQTLIPDWRLAALLSRPEPARSPRSVAAKDRRLAGANKWGLQSTPILKRRQRQQTRLTVIATHEHHSCDGQDRHSKVAGRLTWHSTDV
jgi:hypothetical protein